MYFAYIQSKFSSKFPWVGNWSTVESRRSKRTKADDPQKDESRRSGAKADDLWVKADDPGRKQTIFGSKQTIFWAKADDLWVKADDPGQSGRSRGLKADDPMGQSRRPFLNYNCVKTDDLKGWKQTILDSCWVRNIRQSGISGLWSGLKSKTFYLDQVRTMVRDRPDRNLKTDLVRT